MCPMGKANRRELAAIDLVSMFVRCLALSGSRLHGEEIVHTEYEVEQLVLPFI